MEERIKNIRNVDLDAINDPEIDRIKAIEPPEALPFNIFKMVNFAEHLLPNQNEAELIIKRGIASGSSAVTVSHLVSDFPDERKAFAIRFTAWLAKLGFFCTA